MGDVADRFWARVTKGADAECWLWNGPIHRRPDGSESYGHASLGKRGARALAHRFSYVDGRSDATPRDREGTWTLSARCWGKLESGGAA